jgi:RimJ/RimL family protein N-acetyltransferase
MLQLLPVLSDGSVTGHDDFSPGVSDVLRHTVKLYSQVGYEPPWISYLAIAELLPVGICSFKSPPADGRVEIAYLTFPGFENRGVATEMASRLVAIANGSTVTCIAAQTLPERSASHRVLEKLGFRVVEQVDHPEDGRVLEWQLPRGPESEPERSQGGR